METIDYYSSMESPRVILGSAALNNPTICQGSCFEIWDKIAVGIDAIDGNVAAEGWTTYSELVLIYAAHMEDVGVT